MGIDDYLTTFGPEAALRLIEQASQYHPDSSTLTLEELLKLSGVSAVTEGSDIATIEISMRRLGEMLKGANQSWRQCGQLQFPI